MASNYDRFPRLTIALLTWFFAYLSACAIYLNWFAADWHHPAALALARAFVACHLDGSLVLIPVGGRYWAAGRLFDVLSKYSDISGQAEVLLSVLPWVSVLTVAGGMYWWSKYSSSSKYIVVRGTKLEKPRLTSSKAKSELTLQVGGVPIPRSVECLNILVGGAPGTGKSQIINGFLKTLRQRGDRVVVIDSSGESMATLWREGDKLLNPLDARSQRWSPFSEMRSASDADRIAQSMIPTPAESGDREWALYSQGLVAALLERLYQVGGEEATNERLMYLLTVAKANELEPVVQGLPAQTLFDTGATKMLSSVRGIIGSHLPAYRFLQPSAGANDFSIRDWIADDRGRNWLWMPYQLNQLASIRSLISCWLGETINASLSLRPSQSRRLWIFADELASLGRVSGISEGLQNGRKFGTAFVCGLQSLSQLRSVFGLQESSTLLSCLSTSVCMRAPDSDSAKWWSEYYGDQEIQREETTEHADGTKSKSLKNIPQKTIFSSDISGLRPLNGFLRIANDPHVIRRIVIKPTELGPQTISPFEPR